MNIVEQETLAQTIRVNFERQEDGSVQAVFSPFGKWKIVNRNAASLVKYFSPSNGLAIDKYGQPVTE